MEASAVAVAGARYMVGTTEPISGGGGVTVAGPGVGIKGGGGSALPDRAVPTMSCWGATTGCGSVRAMPTSSRCGATMGCGSVRVVPTSSCCRATVGYGYKPILARGWSTVAMVAAVIISMINCGDGVGLLGPKEALVAATREGARSMVSRRLAIRGGAKGVHRYRWGRQHKKCVG